MNKTNGDVTDLGVGKRLKTARLERKLTLDAVSKELCITKSNLKNIEENSETLTRDVYVIGFVRSYAEFLHLNADELVLQFKEGTPRTQKDDLNFPIPLPQESVPKSRVLLGSAALAILVGFLIHQYSEHGTPVAQLESSDMPAVGHNLIAEGDVLEEDQPALTLSEITDGSEESADQAELETEIVMEGQALSPINKEPESPPTAIAKDQAAPVLIQGLKGNEVLLSVTEDSWVEVRNLIGDVVISKVFQPGETHLFTVEDDLILHTGNAGGITLTVGDYTTPPLGESGEVINHLSLQAEKLLAHYPKNQ